MSCHATYRNAAGFFFKIGTGHSAVCTVCHTVMLAGRHMSEMVRISGFTKSAELRNICTIKWI